MKKIKLIILILLSIAFLSSCLLLPDGKIVWFDPVVVEPVEDDPPRHYYRVHHVPPKYR